MAFIIVRCIILYFVVALAVRIMGKRQIGELQPSELVITILISELAAMPMQDPEQPLLMGVLPILTLAALEIAVSIVTLKCIRARHLFYGKPIIMVYRGVIFQREMEKARVSIDDLTEAMRTNGVLRIEDVDYAILETNGNLSIIQKDGGEMPDIVVIDGRIMEQNLKKRGLDRGWLQNILRVQGVKSEKDIFLLAVYDSGKTYIVKKEKHK